MRNQYLRKEPKDWLQNSISVLKRLLPDDIDSKTAPALLETSIKYLTTAITFVLFLTTKIAKLTAKYKAIKVENHSLKAQNARNHSKISKLEAKISELKIKQAAPRANSKNSHMPSSKDIGGGSKPKTKPDGASPKKKENQQNMVMNPAGLGPENDCAGEEQQKI